MLLQGPGNPQGIPGKAVTKTDRGPVTAVFTVGTAWVSLLPVPPLAVTPEALQNLFPGFLTSDLGKVA